MTEEDDPTRESLRKELVEKHEQTLKPREMGEVLLVTALVISFFGSASVLMPSDSSVSPTGMFSGDLEIDSPVIRDSQLISQDIQNDKISFVHDSEVYNPNIVEASLEEVVYTIKSDGEVIQRTTKQGSTVIPARKTRMVSTLHEINLEGVSDGEEVVQNLSSGENWITVEGDMIFTSAGTEVTESFSKNYRLDSE